MTLSEAILILQRVERGRNARVRASLFKNLDRQRPENTQKDIVVNREISAKVIQRYWRGVLKNRVTLQKKQAELIYLGLATESSDIKQSVLPMVSSLTSKDLQRQNKILQNAQEEAV